MRILAWSTCVLLLVFSLTGCFHMKHEFDGTVYYNRVPTNPGETLGHVDKKKMCGFAVWGLFPWDEAPIRTIVSTSGKEMSITEIKTQRTLLDSVVSAIINGVIYGGVIFEPRTVHVEGDYIDPQIGPAPTDAVY